MTEFKIKLDDQVVQTIGYNTIQQYIDKHILKMILKLSSQEILKDLEEIDMENDAQWKIAREEAWKAQSTKYQL